MNEREHLVSTVIRKQDNIIFPQVLLKQLSLSNHDIFCHLPKIIGFMQKEKNILDFEFKSLYPARYQGNLYLYL